MIYIEEKERLTAQLPGDVAAAIIWDRLGWYVRETILAQHHDARTAVLAASTERDDDGPIIDVEIGEFDKEGWTMIRFQGQPLLRLHVSRLLKGAPLETIGLPMPPV